MSTTRLLGRASTPFVALEVMRRYPASLYRLVPLRKRGGWLVFEVREEPTFGFASEGGSQA